MSSSEPFTVLRPFNLPRDIYTPKSILVIATEGLLNIPEDLKTFTEGAQGLNVHYAKRLPLPCGEDHPPFDLIVLVCKVFDDHSLNSIKRSARHIDLKYLSGKCCILVLAEEDFVIGDETQDIRDFAIVLHAPVHYVSKKKNILDKNKESAKQKRLRLPAALLATYFPPVSSNVSSALIDAVMSPCD